MFVEEADSSESDAESLSAVMKDFKDQMLQIDRATQSIDAQVNNLYTRAREETTDWLNEPLIPSPKLKAWLKGRDLPSRPTLEQFLDACFDAAKTMDLESRVLTFGTADAAALWDGQRRITLFDMIAMLPTLFA